MEEEYFIFKKGKSAGKSIEQVAAEDYLRLKWIYLNILKNESRFKERTREVLERLNKFVPQIQCAAKRPGCEGNARKISIAISYNIFTGECYGLSVSTSYIYCNNRLCLDSIDYEKAVIYPIKFDILENLPPFPLYIRRDVQKVLLRCAGVPEKKTKEACKQWIDNLVIER